MGNEGTPRHRPRRLAAPPAAVRGAPSCLGKSVGPTWTAFSWPSNVWATLQRTWTIDHDYRSTVQARPGAGASAGWVASLGLRPTLRAPRYRSAAAYARRRPEAEIVRSVGSVP